MKITENDELFQHSQDILTQADCLFTQHEVDQAIEQLAEQINLQLQGTHPIVMAIMNGGLITCGLLLPKFNFPLQTDYLHASRYGENTQGGTLKWLAHPSLDIKDRTILLVDDEEFLTVCIWGFLVRLG